MSLLVTRTCEHNISPIIVFCYMTQLTLRQGDYLSVPDIIIEPLKAVFSGWWQKEQKDKSEILEGQEELCILLDWSWRGPYEKVCQRHLGTESGARAESSQESRDPRFTAAGKWILPTAQMSLEVDSCLTFQIRAQLANALILALWDTKERT